MKLYLTFIILVSFFTLNDSYFCQSADSLSVEIKTLEKIYSGLEYNTTAFDDLKLKWIINDPVLVREIYNRFIVKNAIRINGSKIDLDTLSELSEPVFSGNALITARKRYYDNEIEEFSFIHSSDIDKDSPIPIFDPVKDGFYLKEIIGKKLYTKIQNQEYFYRDITKDEFDTEAGYYFDIDLNLLNPNLMFWSTTSKNEK